MVSRTITRLDYPKRVEQIVDFDLSTEDAEALIEAGRAEPGPGIELPPAVFLNVPMFIGGLVRPAGSQLQVGGEITAAEAHGLLRGPLKATETGVYGIGGVALKPRGGVG